MDWWELLLIAIGLAMDAFAVSVCKGVSMKNAGWRQGLLLGGCFGGFQFAMPVAGYVLGVAFADVVAAFDHWLAFALLAIVGGHMIRDGFRPESASCTVTLRTGELLGLGVATSIDAFAVGLSLAFLDSAILMPAAVIGIVAFLLSLAGFLLGRRIGTFLRRRAGVFGGVILLFLAIRILLSHLGIWS